MKKILIAFDGDHYSEGALEFAKRLNEKSPVFLAGLFLPQIDYSALWSYSGGGKVNSFFIPLLEDGDSIAVQANMMRFENFCQENKIEHTMHKDFLDFALPELKKESRFADLLILSSEKFFEQAGNSGPNDYLNETLFEVECPVIVVPEKFDFPSTNILAYDGKENSVYALKQFTYLFPELTNNETMLVYVDAKEQGDLPQRESVKELASRHYQKLSLYHLEANPRKEFASWVKDKKASILISGAFGGSGLSKLFHKSFTADVIREHRLPVFIAHK